MAKYFFLGCNVLRNFHIFFHAFLLFVITSCLFLCFKNIFLIFFSIQVNIFLVFLDHFDALILKLIFKK
jgi:hypothetical protein